MLINEKEDLEAQYQKEMNKMNRKIKTIGKIIMFIMTAIALVSFVFCITYEITNIYIKVISMYSGAWLGGIILINFACNLIDDDKK